MGQAPREGKGILRTGLRALGSILRTMYSRRRDLLFDFDFRGPMAAVPAGVEVEYRAAQPAEVESFLGDPAHEVSSRIAQRCRALLATGETFFIGLAEGRIVYHAWAVRQSWRIAGPHRIKMGKGKAVIAGCHTIAACRGKGIYPAALAAHLGLLREMGATRVFINSDVTNQASLRGIEKAGFRRMGSFEAVRLGGKVILRIEPELRRALESDAPP